MGSYLLSIQRSRMPLRRVLYHEHLEYAEERRNHAHQLQRVVDNCALRKRAAAADEENEE